MSSSSNPSSDANMMMKCDDCGKLFPKSSLRRCHKCGRVVCPTCQKSHVCPPKKEWKRADDSHQEDAGDYLTCDYCHKSFPSTYMRRCRNCGVLLCPDCLKTHDCRWQPPNRDEAVPLHRPVNESYSVPVGAYYQNQNPSGYPNSGSTEVLDPDGYQGDYSGSSSSGYGNPGSQPNQIPIYHEVVHEVPVYHEVIREVPSYPPSGYSSGPRYEEVVQRPYPQGGSSAQKREKVPLSPGMKKFRLILVLLIILCVLVLFAMLIVNNIIPIPWLSQ